MTETFDFVIVGAGSAGCAMAYRLSEEGKNTVCVLEFGGSDRGPFIQMPSALSYPMNMKFYNWGFESEPEPGLGGRRLATPRGKVVGGSSSINGMVYVRGHAKDFDTWEDMGAKGWGFRHVQPYFKRQESSHGSNPLYQAFIEAGRQAGYPVTEDYNGRQQEGFGAMEMTVHDGIRWSAANAYLRPAMKRGNVRLITRALARRVLLEGRRAVGVEYESGGTVRQVRARREVIIAASSINSPKLLQMSGIGAPETLKAAGLDVVHALKGVGENLQDHLEVYFQFRSKEPVTLHSKLNWFSKGLIGARWMFLRSGLGATNHFESCGFIRSAAGIEYPDIQYHFLPAAMRYDGRAAYRGHGFQVHVGPMRSKSRGFVRVRSNDPREAPRILFNYLTHPDDLPEWRSAVRLTREVFRQPAMQRFVAEELQPGPSVEDDAGIDAFIREHCESAYHPCGTCRMGAVDDPMAVVDPQCRVIGIEGLRVADSSIMPQVTNGNLNAPTIMIGEKASDHILGKDPLPPSNQEPWINPDWRTRQR